MGELTTYNFADVWEAVVDRIPERMAISCAGRNLTYGELEERSNRLAHHLAARGVALPQRTEVGMCVGRRGVTARPGGVHSTSPCDWRSRVT